MIPFFQRPKRIEVRCPACGHAQAEPARVVSSLCRSCGEHFRVQKGVAVPDPGLRVSGLAEVDGAREEGPARPFALDPRSEPPEEEAWLVSAEDAESGPRGLAVGEERDREPCGISAGAFFGLVDEEDLRRADEADALAASERGILLPAGADPAPDRDALSRGSLGTLIGGGRGVLAEDSRRMPPDFAPRERRRVESAAEGFPVRCFRCHHVQKVSKHAKSTQCTRCSVYISLADYEIKSPKRLTLRTRGDIVIARRGALTGCEIACHHLTVNGGIDARVDCTGEALFRRSGTVRGSLHCQRVVVEKGCEIRFPDGLKTARADIHGSLVGDVASSGKVTVFRRGSVDGDIRAAEIEVRPGGEVSGRSETDPGVSIELPLRFGFNPSVIS